MFEPNSKNIDWGNFTFQQIKAAFFCRKPAIISSYRVNFVGSISKPNREQGLSELRKLLSTVLFTWPDVQFMGSKSIL